MKRSLAETRQRPSLLLVVLLAVSALFPSLARAEFYVWHDASGHKQVSSIPRDGFAPNGTIVRRHNPNSIVYQQQKMIARLNDQALRIAELAAEKKLATQTSQQPTTLRRIAPIEGTMNLNELIDLEKRGGRFVPDGVK